MEFRPGGFSLQTLALLQYYPLPNFDGDSRYNFQVPLITHTHTDNLQLGTNKTYIGRCPNCELEMAIYSLTGTSALHFTPNQHIRP